MSERREEETMQTRASIPDCPPRDTEIEGMEVVYRCCSFREPSPEDFKTHVEEGSHPFGSPCEREALSLSLSYEHARTRLGYKRRGSEWICVRSATFAASHGNLQKTTEHHANWWPPEGMGAEARTALFVLASGD